MDNDIRLMENVRQNMAAKYGIANWQVIPYFFNCVPFPGNEITKPQIEQ